MSTPAMTGMSKSAARLLAARCREQPHLSVMDALASVRLVGTASNLISVMLHVLPEREWFKTRGADAVSAFELAVDFCGEVSNGRP